MKIKTILLVQMIIHVHLLYAQTNLHCKKTNSVVLNLPDSLIKTSIYNGPKHIPTHEGRLYYWYESNTVKSNINGFHNKVLHGEYYCFDNEKNLISQGQFTYGTMSGLWKYWNKDGTIKRTEEWQLGEKHGKFVYYEEDGRIINVKRFRKNKLCKETVFGPQVENHSVETQNRIRDKKKKKEMKKNPGTIDVNMETKGSGSEFYDKLKNNLRVRIEQIKERKLNESD